VRRDAARRRGASRRCSKRSTAETGAAIAISTPTALGSVIRTTHTITGAIIGVATSRLSAVCWGVAARIVWAWVLTIPASAAIGALSYWAVAAFGIACNVARWQPRVRGARVRRPLGGSLFAGIADSASSARRRRSSKPRSGSGRAPCAPRERSSESMARDDLIQATGTVEKILGGGRYQIGLDGGQSVTAQLSGRMRRFRIRVIPGDRVQVGLSPYDPSHGFITFRLREGEGPQNPA
jgi:translation initiation factor IF-1